jgi:beta-mannanase
MATRALTPTTTPEPIATLNAAGHIGLGVYFDGLTPYDDFASVQTFERQNKHKMQYVLWFQAWGDADKDLNPAVVKSAQQKGLTPVITWEPWKRDFKNTTAIQPAYSLQSIAAGGQDAYLRPWARAARDSGVPMIIRFAHEQSTEPGTRSWYPWQGDPQAYKAAFRYIVKLFREEQARNVRFLWSAIWLDQWASQYYPGDDVVDMVGTTTLNHGTGADVSWAKWRTFDDLFSGQYQAALKWGKPVLITEMATAEQGGSKAAWLRDAFASIRQKYTLVAGVLVLEMVADRDYPAINWSVSSSPASLAAFQAAIANPYFK